VCSHQSLLAMRAALYGIYMSPRNHGVQSEIDPQQLDNPALSSLKAYWNLKRAERKMPSRADIRPADLKENLGWIVLLDVVPEVSDFRYRTIGTRVTQFMLADATGKTISEALSPLGKDAAEAMKDLHRRSAEGEIPIRAFGGADWLGRPYFRFDALFLPLSDDGARANRIISAFTFSATAGGPQFPSSRP
jgi:hypothetical protein